MAAENLCTPLLSSNSDENLRSRSLGNMNTIMPPLQEELPDEQRAGSEGRRKIKRATRLLKSLIDARQRLQKVGKTSSHLSRSSSRDVSALSGTALCHNSAMGPPAAQSQANLETSLDLEADEPPVVRREKAGSDTWTRRKVEAASPGLPLPEALKAMDTYSRVRRRTLREKTRSARHRGVAVRVASWSLLLCMPIIIWPAAEWLAEHTAKLQIMTFWGSAMLQFLFVIGPNLGATIQYTTEALLGTAIASMNMIFLNHVFPGGAYADRVEVTLPVNASAPGVLFQSTWLPVCDNRDAHFFAIDSDGCFGNIRWAHSYDVTLWKAGIVFGDYVLLVALVFAIGFNSSTRVFAITTHTYFVMTFLDPTTAGFAQVPSLGVFYFWMVFICSIANVLAYLYPTVLDALSLAKGTATDAAHALSLLLETLPFAASELARRKMQATLDELDILLSELEEHVKFAFFEDMGGLLKDRARDRLRLEVLLKAFRDAKVNIPALLTASTALPRGDEKMLMLTMPAIRGVFAMLGKAFRACAHEDSGWAADLDALQDADRRVNQIAIEFASAKKVLSPTALVVTFEICGVASDAQVAARLTTQSNEHPPRINKGILSILRTWRQHLDLKLKVRDATHPRFVLRSTLSISLAFWLGWTGLNAVVNSYSFKPANTAAVVIYTYAGTSTPVTLKRLNGLMLAAVIGSIAQHLLAVQAVFNTLCFSVFLWFFVAILIYFSLHSQEYGLVASLTCAWGVSSMIPGNGLFRENNVQVDDPASALTFQMLAASLVGVAIILVVDSMMASKARWQARQRLERALRLTGEIVDEILDCSQVDKTRLQRQKSVHKQLIDDLDQLQQITPYASAEAGGQDTFPGELFQTMEASLRSLASQFRTLWWATHVLQERLNPGSQQGSGQLVGPEFLQNAESEHIWKCLKEELQLMVQNVSTLAQNVLSGATVESAQLRKTVSEELLPTDEEDLTPSPGQSEVERVREIVASKLYSRQNALLFSSKARSPWEAVVNLINGEDDSDTDGGEETESSDDESQQNNEGDANEALGPVQAVVGLFSGIMNQIIDEKLEVGNSRPSDAPGLLERREKGVVGADSSVRLLKHFNKLRMHASLVTGSSPLTDPLSLVELISFLINQMHMEIQKLQLSLLEF
eukprot:TRINITY_DN12929_c0_g1_i1.p1 TRINITY_DN12929_c0_g1~~TRINITY_DN12929_c0_g1_i1.p1  ORF type:complete len:1148 (-),score=206.12 TRINITY_DN12929_c0_g1_i1:122-3565(-)